MTPFEERLLKSAELRRSYPNNSTCGRCQTPWAACQSHVTSYEEDSGCFPLCEECWRELETPDARLPFYLAMIAWWQTMAPIADEKRDKIIAAVLAGK